jgi:hypothetical protein
MVSEWKALQVAPQGLVQRFGRNVRQGSQIRIQHHSPTPDDVDQAFQRLLGISLRITKDVSSVQNSHLAVSDIYRTGSERKDSRGVTTAQVNPGGSTWDKHVSYNFRCAA